jgi:glucans biosynthesis protein
VKGKSAAWTAERFCRPPSPALLGGQFALLAGRAEAQEAPAEPFSFDTVIQRARAAAAQPFQRPLIELSEPFADLTYDRFRGIRFRDEARMFTEGQGFQMDLMPPGFYYVDKVEVNIVSAA